MARAKYFRYHDGGRVAAGYRGKTGDCVVRSIAIATGLPYQHIYDMVNRASTRERTGTRKRGISNARTGVYKSTIHRVMKELGWTWTPTMQIGSGCKVHLRPNELPHGRLVVSVSKHLTTMIDGIIYDTHDCSRRGKRCVYGYWQPPPRRSLAPTQTVLFEPPRPRLQPQPRTQEQRRADWSRTIDREIPVAPSPLHPSPVRPPRRKPSRPAQPPDPPRRKSFFEWLFS
jgi:hypothetical protein